MRNSPPPEIQEVIAEILRMGLLQIRAMASELGPQQCSLEADHLHNLPTLLTAYEPNLLDYYWNVERPCYVRKATREQAAIYESLWEELAGLIKRRQADF